MTMGILPAAGSATRMNGLPKFLLPIPPSGTLIGRHCVQMQAAGVDSLAIGYGETTMHLLTRHTPQNITLYSGGDTLSQTIINAERLAGDQNVVFGMPDTYWTDEFVYQRLLSALDDGTLISVALFYVNIEQTSKLGMCGFNLDDTGSFVITHVIDKPQSTTLRNAWGAIAWRPEFWRYMKADDLTIGYALQRAIEDGVRPRAYLSHGGYYDCGTPNEYFKFIREMTEVIHATI